MFNRKEPANTPYEGAPPPGKSLLQTRNKLCSNGHIGLLPAVLATPLFVQCLGLVIYHVLVPRREVALCYLYG